MKDYNFFELYEKKKKIDISLKSPYFVGAMILFICIILSIGLTLRNVYLTYQINDLNQKYGEIQLNPQLAEANRLQTSINAMGEYDISAELALNKFYNNKIIGTDLMNQISAAIPSVVSINSFKMDNSLADISFQVPSRKAAAELILSLKKTGIFQDVVLISIFSNQQGSGFVAYTACIMKAGEAK